MHEIAQFAEVARPRIVTQPVLRRDTEAAQRQTLLVYQPIDVVAQELRDVLGIVTQCRHAQRDHVQLHEQIAAERLIASASNPAAPSYQRAPSIRSHAADPRVARGLQIRRADALHDPGQSSSPPRNSVPPSARP